MMLRRCLSLSILISLLAAPALAGHAVIFVADTDDAGDCAAAQADYGLIAMAWRQGGDLYTSAIEGCYWYGPDNHGPGSLPELCNLGDRTLLAYAQGDSIRIRGFDEFTGQWSDIATLGGNGEAIVHVKLTGWQPGVYMHEAYLCWETADGTIWFSRGDPTSWLPGEPVMQHDGYEFARPHAQPIEYGALVWPRIYYLHWDSLKYVDGIGAWSAPSVAMDWAGGDFEAAAGPGYSQHLLTLGPQPTCPCNIILYSEQTYGGAWLTPEEITVNQGVYDWPQFPRLGVDGEGHAHAFWYQESADAMMNPTGETLFYFQREGGVWEDLSVELDGRFGIQGDLCMDGSGSCSMIWNEAGVVDREIWCATTTSIGMNVPTAPGEFALTAHPNPFNPHTEIHFALEEAAAVTLTVHDPAGRRVRGIAGGSTFPAGASSLRWDGTDDAGRPLPSGVYLVSVEASGRKQSARAVLLK